MLKYLLLCFLFTSSTFANPTNERILLENIAASVRRVKTSPPTLRAGSNVCYPDIGCFEADGPMRQTDTLPSSPESIGTKFNAYTAEAPTEAKLIDPYSIETFSTINPSKRLVIISHGFGMNGDNAQLNEMKNNLLKYSHDEVGTVILVDWSKGAASPDYLTAAANTQVVGRQIAHLVNQLRLHRTVRPEAVYLIGFSLGAQVSGFAGKYAQSEYGWTVGRITGLDAAAPMFEGYPGSHLTATDALFVDGIHSSAGGNILLGEVGFIEPYGHLDFYPNGGKKQPHCGIFSGITCNHYGSVLFYDASLHAKDNCKFHGARCDSWEDYASAKCPHYDAELGYWAEMVRNGGKRQVFGSRFLKTTKKVPFCG